MAFPFDAAKTKLQTFPREYNGPLRCLLETFRTQGTTGLYRGLTPAIWSNVNECTVVFTSYGVWQDCVKRAFGVDRDRQMHRGERVFVPACFSLLFLCQPTTCATFFFHLYFAGHNYLAGGLTGITASVFLCPSELVKCRLQALKEMELRAEKRGFKHLQLAPK